MQNKIKIINPLLQIYNYTIELSVCVCVCVIVVNFLLKTQQTCVQFRANYKRNARYLGTNLVLLTIKPSYKNFEDYFLHIEGVADSIIMHQYLHLDFTTVLLLIHSELDKRNVYQLMEFDNS